VVEFDLVEKNVKGIGTIDALTSGFNLIARRPWAILLPVIINLLIWLGPTAGIAPLVQEIADGLRATATLQTGPYGEWVQSASQALAEWGDAINLFDVLAVGIPVLAVPPQGQSALHLDTWPGVAGVLAALLLGGICLLALYVVIIAQEVRGTRVAIGPVVGWTGRVAWRIMMLGIVLLGIATLISLPGLMIIGILSLFSLQGAAILSSLLVWAALFLMIWLLFYLFFVLDAIALDDVGVRHAVSRSVVLVRHNSGPTLALILLTMLLGLGLGEVWLVIAKSTPGIVAGIIANGYVSTALVAASLIFYSSRWHALQKQFGALAMPVAEKAAEKDQTDRPSE
jgi:hypothetical protein